MRFTKTNVTALSGVTALLTLGAAANAQINIVNTIGNGSKWAINGSRSASQPIGYDPASVIAPNTAAEAGYAVLPFTVNSSLGVSSISGITIAFNIQSPDTGNTSNLSSLSGAIVPANASNSLSLTGLTPASFFSFDTTPNGGDPSNNNPNVGDGITHLYSATGLPSYMLDGGQTYWLVIAPKKGLGAKAGDTLLDFGLWNSRNANFVTQSGGAVTNPYAVVGAGLAEQSGANAGDTLSAINGYFGATISGTVVPEPSSVLALVGGVVMAGGLTLRRRKK